MLHEKYPNETLENKMDFLSSGLMMDVVKKHLKGLGTSILKDLALDHLKDLLMIYWWGC